MQFQQNNNSFKRLSLILGNQTVQKFKQIVILIVGVGGIGCQILKNLSKHPVKKIVIIDMDIIELSNLNRQFYFRTNHLLQSKSKIVRKQILKISPHLNIEPIQGNIYDKKFNNYHFYSQFDLVISALDNMKARQYLAKNCTKYGKTLIDAGTSGFNGQSYASIRFVTSCHNCYPLMQQQSFAVCTIRTRPQKSIHCAIYAKNVYENIFGEENQDFFDNQLKQIKRQVFKQKDYSNQQKIKDYGIKLFDYLFNHQYELYSDKNSNDIDINYLTFQRLKLIESLHNISYSSNREYDQLWSLSQYAQQFLVSFTKLIIRKLTSNHSKPSLFYDKDDQDCSIFVYCITNLRIYNFINTKHQNSLKYLTLQQCRRMIGKLIPAIASTNSIAASLELKQIKDFICNTLQPVKYLTISPFHDDKISFSWISLPNSQCEVCSAKNLYFQVVCNLNDRTFEQFGQFSRQNCYSFDRDIYCQDLILIKNLNAKKISSNKIKRLNFKPNLIIEDTLTLKYLPATEISDLKVQIVLINKNNESLNGQKFVILNKQIIKKTIQVLKNKANLKFEVNNMKFNQKQIEQDDTKQQYLQIE